MGKIGPLIILLSLVAFSHGAKILALFPFLGSSHFIMFSPIVEELARRGHNVTVVSPFPRKQPMENYTDVSLKGLMPYLNNKLPIGTFNDIFGWSVLRELNGLYWLVSLYEPIFQDEKFQQVYRESYDLVIIEQFNSDMFLGVVHKLRAPFVSVATHMLMPWSFSRFGNPSNPSYVPGTFSSGLTPSFADRFFNSIGMWISQLSYKLFFDPFSQRMAEKYLGPLPRLSDIAKNASLMLMNSHHTIHPAIPLVPQIVQVGGLHIKDRKPLPQELKQILDSSTQGVIYFCMGSVLRGETWPEGMKLAFIKTFSRLKQTILWKWESDEIPEEIVKAKNIYVNKWFPQVDILAHHNMALFITHGGMNGILEASHYGVPILGIPVFGDQRLNVWSFVRAGAGLKLDIMDINEKSLSQSFEKLLLDPSYMLKARDLSRRFRDRPMSPMDTTMYWIEYALCYKNPSHLRSSAVHLHWYEYYILDIITCIILIALVLTTIIYCISKIFFKSLYSSLKYKKKQKM